MMQVEQTTAKIVRPHLRKLSRSNTALGADWENEMTYLHSHYKLAAIAIVLVMSNAYAQEGYRLVTPDGSIRSSVERSDQELVIVDGQANITRYVRDPKFDDDKGEWISYFNAELRQVVHWPVQNVGKLEIGRMDRQGRISFRPSVMEIERVRPNEPADGSKTNPMQLLQPPLRDRDLGEGTPDAETENLDQQLAKLQQVPLWLGQPASQGSGTNHFLSRASSNRFSMLNQVANDSAAWNIVPVSGGMVRVQFQQQNRFWALGCNRRNQVGWFPIAGDCGQLWRIYPCFSGGYLFESVLFPGQCLSWWNQALVLQPIIWSPPQIWFPYFPPIAPVVPVMRTVAHQIIPNPALPPAEVDFVNRHDETVWMLLNDRRAGNLMRSIRIPAGGSETIKIDRDAGATIEETYEFLLSNGQWGRETYTSVIPPAVWYDVSVYVEFLQSIAIDRTGTSPSPIEDINYQPKSIGWFLLPPGPLLEERSRLEPYFMAKAAGNPGAVRQIDRGLIEKPEKTRDPLRELLLEIQSQRGAF